MGRLGILQPQSGEGAGFSDPQRVCRCYKGGRSYYYKCKSNGKRVAKHVISYSYRGFLVVIIISIAKNRILPAARPSSRRRTKFFTSEGRHTCQPEGLHRLLWLACLRPLRPC